MTPADPNASQPQPNQRIWPTAQANHTAARTPLKHRIATRLRKLMGAATALTSPPGAVTTPDGVIFQPLARTSLESALADTGPGYLDFAVTFPDSLNTSRKRLRIRATRDRVFHDLQPNNPEFKLLAHAALVSTCPGDRVLLLGAGTGALTAVLADHVGPAGAVTAFEADAQSVAFARARYPLPNAAHERLNASTLTAEPEAAAETMILTPIAPTEGRLANPAELLGRLTRPGRLLLAGSHASLADACQSLPGITAQRLTLKHTAHHNDSPFVLVRKPPKA